MMQLTTNTPRLGRWSLFLLVVFAFSVRWGTGIALADAECATYCGPDRGCDDSCLDDYDQDNTCGGYNGGASNGECTPDCSDICGPDTDCNTVCEGSDDGTCGTYGGGKDDSWCYGTCGDGVCQMHEEGCSTCPEDCQSCPVSCSTAECNSDADCSGNPCNDGCCVEGCTGDYCGGNERECEDEYEVCGPGNPCCDDEICGSVNGGDQLCYEIIQDH